MAIADQPDPTCITTESKQQRASPPPRATERSEEDDVAVATATGDNATQLLPFFYDN
jgi:hypothetical protein